MCLVEGGLEYSYAGRIVSISVGSDRIESTSDHPFRVISGADLAARPAPRHVPADEPGSVESGRWVDAGDLLVGDELLSRDGRSLKIDVVEARERTLPVYNLRVAELHTFCVGQTRVLVHNREGTSWSKARRDYWKGRAKQADPGEFSEANFKRMQQGNPPRHDELGCSKELHHRIPQRNGGSHAPENLQELWPWEHADIDPFRHYKGPRP